MKRLIKGCRGAAVTAGFMCLVLGACNAAITIVLVDATETLIPALGGDRMGFSSGYYFGTVSSRLERHSADGFRPSSLIAYFQSTTPLPDSFLRTNFSSTAVYTTEPFAGATPGINYTGYDLDEDGAADSLFKIDLGDDLADATSFRIVAYALDASGLIIDFAAARSELESVPESASSFFLLVGAGCVIFRRCRPRCENVLV